MAKLLILFALLFQYTGSAAARQPVAPIHYALRLRIDTTSKSINGLVRVRLPEFADSLILHSEALNIDSVRFGKRPIVFTQANDTLRLLDLKAKEATIYYHGCPKRGLKIAPKEIFSAFHTAAWMPCNDNPASKATYDLDLTLPSSYTVVAAGREFGHNHDRAVTIWHFRETNPIPAYIFGFAAGHWTESHQRIGNVTLRYLADGFAKTQLDMIFSSTKTALKAFEQITGIRYPAETYTQILTYADNEQEADAYCLLSKDYALDVLNEPRENWLIVHELCHQWFGNRVTCANWSDYWLHEGLTSYLTACVKGQMFGRNEFDREIALARMRYARVVATQGDRAIVQNGWTKPEDMGGVVTYYKAALILNLLRSQIGDSAFWRGIRNYAQENWNGNVTTNDFEKSVEQASGQNLFQFFEYWYEGDSCPEFEASYEIAGDSIRCKVNQVGNEFMPLTLTVAIETDERRDTITLQLNFASKAVTLPLHGHLLSVRFDANNALPVPVHIALPTAMLIYQSTNEPDVIGRVQAMTALVDSLNTSVAQKDVVMSLLRESQTNDPARFGRDIAGRLITRITTK